MAFANAGKTWTNVKLFAASIGAGALVAMAALGVGIGQDHADAEVVAKSSSMTVGPTSTLSTPPSALPTAVAVPAIKGPAPLPSEEAAAK